MGKFKVWDLLKSDAFLISAVFVFALFLRLQFLFAIKNDPAFVMPIIDSLEFDVWACSIFNGNILWTALQNHTPLYAYFVALIYKLFGYGVIKVALAQYLLGSFSCVLGYFIAKKLVNKTAAVISGILMASYWFFIYVQSFIFSETLSLFLNLLLIAVLIFFKENWGKYFIGGLLLGLSVICRPDILLFVFLVFFYILSRKLKLKKVILYYLLFFFGFICMIGPVLLRNYYISQEFPMLRTQFGANFYMGNNPEFKGTSIDLEIGKQWDDFISLPNRTENRQLKESEADKFFIKETVKIIKDDPLRWVKLILTKSLEVISGNDFLRSEDVYFYDKYVSSMPFAAVSTSLISIFALIGIVLSFVNARKFFLLYLFVLAESFMLFFPIKTRYLLPIVPFFIIFAAYTVNCLYYGLREKRLGLALAIVFSVAIMNFISFISPLGIHNPGISEVYFAIAKNYDSRGITDGAIKYYMRTIALNPRSVSAYNDLGVLFMRLHEYDKARDCFQKALYIDKDALYPKLNYKICTEALAKNKAN